MLTGGVIYIIGMLVMLSSTAARQRPGRCLAAWSRPRCHRHAHRVLAVDDRRGPCGIAPRRRSTGILGVVGACSSVGTLVVAPSLQFLLARWDWHVGVVFFLLLTVAMLPFAYMAGAVDRIPHPVQHRATMRDVLGEVMRNRRFLVMSGAYFVCGLQLIFLTTHLPNYLAICGQDPMLSASALATIGGVNIVGSWFAGWLGGKFPRNTFCWDCCHCADRSC